MVIDFDIPIVPTIGSLGLRMFGESQPIDTAGNALDFLGTATFTADPEQGFLGLATGLAFVSDADAGVVTGVPEPATLSLLAFGLAGIAWVRRRKLA